jgi:alcohol dehydrogenase class IV
MNPFKYFQPTEIRFGAGRIAEAGEAAARLGRRCLLVTEPVFPAVAPLHRKLRESLKAAGIPFAHFEGVVAQPTTDVISAGARLAREFGADVVLGLGGGSSMDTAKAVAVESTHEGSCWDYLFFRAAQPTERTLPIVAVTTTSGTGSQVTQVAVVTNPREKNKSALFHSRLYPKISIVDPELMVTVPKHVTASTGFDVLAHAFESYINPGGSAYTDMMALEAMRIVAAFLPAAVENGADLEARTRMAWADTLGGLCIANAGVTLFHGIGMAMGGLYPHVAHGEALASIYPAVMRYSWDAAPEKFAVAGRIFDRALERLDDTAAAERSSEAIASFLGKIGLRIGLEDLKIPEDGLSVLARASLVLPDYKNHPRIAGQDDVYAVLKNSLGSGGNGR